MLELIVQQPKDIKADVWELKTTGMSGDADASIAQSLFSDNKWLETPFENLVKMAIACFVIYGNGYEFERKQIEQLEEFTKKLGVEWDASDFYCSTFGMDVTSEGCNAAPEKLEVFYYNLGGVRLPVKVLVNGKDYKKVTSLEELL